MCTDKNLEWICVQVEQGRLGGCQDKWYGWRYVGMDGIMNDSVSWYGYQRGKGMDGTVDDSVGGYQYQTV